MSDASWPELAVAHDLVAAAARDDAGVIETLREESDADWWKVSVTLAYLLRDVHVGKQEALELLDELIA